MTGILPWISVPTQIYDDVTCLIEKVAWGQKQPTLGDWDTAFENTFEKNDPNTTLADACNRGYQPLQLSYFELYVKALISRPAM